MPRPIRRLHRPVTAALLGLGLLAAACTQPGASPSLSPAASEMIEHSASPSDGEMMEHSASPSEGEMMEHSPSPSAP